MQYVFKAGFSTAEKVTSVSGRGVGMDVVRTNIEKIGGTVSLSSARNKGSTFHIKIPLTLAIVSVLLVESCGQRFALPQLNVVELVRVGRDSEHHVETIHGAAVLRLRDKLLPLMTLAEILHLPTLKQIDVAADLSPEAYVAVLRVGATDFGLVLDQIYDTEEIVVKPVTSILHGIDVYSGNTILGDGSVIMILDPNGVLKCFGGRELAARSDDVPLNAAHQHVEKIAGFLVFEAGKGAPKAVPLELVSRLEVVSASAIERSGDDYVVQYRGDLMRLKTLPGIPMPERGDFDVVVFTYDGRTIGLAVDAICDILQAPLAIKLASSVDHLLGSMVLLGKTTDILDVGYLLKDLVGDISSLSDHPSKGSGEKVLLVEDSVFFRKLIVPFLEEAGYQVTEAGDAHEALGIVAANKNGFDLVVTDIEMPELDGFELAVRLRADARYARVPILAFTSTVNDIFRQRASKVGMDGLIIKTDREALLQAMAESLQRIAEVA
jgi:two-component system, chemotaxis family, sensor kinase CheA